MINLMLDSGAFSCWRQQKTIDLHKYMDFILDNEAAIEVPVGLDVIPGQRGQRPTVQQMKDSATAGLDNLLYMRACGIEAVPVFHQGEPFEWLEEIMSHDFEWIGFGPRNDDGVGRKKHWLDQCFRYLCGSGGFPRAKVHGFALTAPELMTRYPWTTVDSMSWLLQASMGNIIVPRMTGDGEWDFINPLYLPVSMRKSGLSANAMRPGGHWLTLGESQRDTILRYIGELEHELDMDLPMERLSEEYVLRDVVNICLFLRVLEAHPIKPYKHRGAGFHDHAATLPGEKAPSWNRTRLLFSVPMSSEHGQALNMCGVRDRLLTYFFLRDKPFDVATYTRTGSMELAHNVSKTSFKEGPMRRPVFGCGRPS